MITVLYDPTRCRYLLHDPATDRYALAVPIAWQDGCPTEFQRTTQYVKARVEG